jgi:O-antigen ligase
LSRKKRRSTAHHTGANTAPFVPQAGAARVLVVAVLALTPLTFSRLSLEAFEFPKALLVLAAAIVLGGGAFASLAGAAGGLTAPRLLSGLRRDPVALAVIGFAASATISTVTSISPFTSLLGEHETFGGLVTVWSLAVLFFASRALATNFPARLTLLAAPVVPATAAAVHAVIQAGGFDPFPWAGTASFSGVTRVFATLGHPNLLGAYLSMTLPLTAWLAALALRRGLIRPGRLLAASAFLQVVAAVITSSRAAWLAVAASTVLLAAGWLASAKRREAFVVLASPVLAASVLAGASFLAVPEGSLLASLGERARKIAEAPSRREIWRTSLAIHDAHRWLGSGLDTFRLAFAPRRTVAYAEIEWNTSPTHAHNAALQVLATQGSVGAAALGLLAAALGWRLVRVAIRESGETREMAAGIGAALTAFGVVSAFGGTSSATASLASVLAGVASGMALERGSAGHGLPRQLELGLLLAIAAAAALFLANAPTARHGLALGLVVLAPALLAGRGVVAVLRASKAERLPGTGDPSRSDAALTSAGPIRRVRGGGVAGWMLVAAALFLLVIAPLAADTVARRGRELAVVDPEAAVAAHRRSVTFFPWREVLWIRLGAAAHAAGVASRSPEAARRDLTLAREAFERATRLAPPDPYPHMQLAGTLAELTRRGRASGAEAVARADRAIAMDPNNAFFYVAATNIGLAVGDIEKARGYAQRCRELYPRFGAPRYLLGRVALLAGRAEEALVQMEAAFEAEWYGDAATRARVAVELAQLLAGLGRRDQAEWYARWAREH